MKYTYHYLVLSNDSTENLSSFPNFSITGSIEGMVMIYYGSGANLIRKGDYIYKVDEETFNEMSNSIDVIKPKRTISFV